MTSSSPQIRILHLVEDLKVGGLERVLADIVKGLDRNRFEPVVWCLARGGQIADELSQSGIEVQVLGLSNYYNPLNVWRLARKFKSAKIDVIHSHAYFANTFGRFANLLAGLPYFAHTHTLDTSMSPRNFRIDGWLTRRNTKMICCSNAARDYLVQKENAPEPKLEVIYNGVACERFTNPPANISELKNKYGIASDDLVLGMVARFVSIKGQDLLLDAAAEIVTKHPNVKILFVGDGPERTLREEQARKLGLSQHVIFAGLQADVAPFLHLMDIFILCSRREGLPLSVVEAMSAGKPVVASNVGGLPEVVIQKETGLIIPELSSKLLAEAVNILFANQEIRDKMGRKSRQRAQEVFSLKSMLDKIQNLYLDAVKK